jgi:hypothetical protein
MIASSPLKNNYIRMKKPGEIHVEETKIRSNVFIPKNQAHKKKCQELILPLSVNNIVSLKKVFKMANHLHRQVRCLSLQAEHILE